MLSGLSSVPTRTVSPTGPTTLQKIRGAELAREEVYKSPKSIETVTIGEPYSPPSKVPDPPNQVNEKQLKGMLGGSSKVSGQAIRDAFLGLIEALSKSSDLDYVSGTNGH